MSLKYRKYPGDFALVARRARVLTEGNARVLMKMLADEVTAKPSGGRRIGFEKRSDATG